MSLYSSNLNLFKKTQSKKQIYKEYKVYKYILSGKMHEKSKEEIKFHVSNLTSPFYGSFLNKKITRFYDFFEFYSGSEIN